MKNIIIAATAAMLGAASCLAQSTPAPAVPVTILVSPASAATIADLQSNGVPMDTVISLGARDAFSKAQIRLRQQMEGMSLQQLSAAYPTLASLTDTNADPAIQWQQMRQLAAMQLSRVHNATEVNAVAAKHLAAMRAFPKPGVDPNAASQQYLMRTNLFEQ
jgi:hypothetical protein